MFAPANTNVRVPEYNVRMLSPKTQYSLSNAKEYFEEHLCVGDYYSEGEGISAQWFGEGAKRLHLSGNGEGRRVSQPLRQSQS